MLTATNLPEEHLIALIDSATNEGTFLWFETAIEHGRQNGASEHDIEVFMGYRDDPNPEARREFIKAFLRRAFREGWANRFDLVPGARVQ